jgi:SRSO17 transposase
MSDVRRKNGWQLAERLGMKSPLALQRLLNEATWDADEVLRVSRQLLTQAGTGDELGIGGVGVVDESSFIKKGAHSAGVKRQYCGRLGKVENCQVGVFLGFVSMSVQGFLDRRLYLPQDWCEDEARCDAARIPKEARVFRTKPELASDMLKAAWAEGIKMSWVTGDTLYGNSPSFRQAVSDSGRHYVLAVTQNHKVRCRGRQRIDALLATLSPEDWSVTTSRAGEQGLLEEHWAFLRVGFADQEQWLIFRRAAHDTEAYLSNAPEDTSTATLLTVILSRYSIERCLQEAKSDLGLADYEVRYFHAWQRHVTLCLLAHGFLALCRHEQRKKNASAALCLSQPRGVPNAV